MTEEDNFLNLSEGPLSDNSTEQSPRNHGNESQNQKIPGRNS